MSTQGVVLFHTTSAAMRAEKTLLRAGLTVKLVPTPRHLSSDCGIALRFDWPAAAAARKLLEEANVPVAGVYPL
ncbi:MAG: DUF3343 domain-containing protein [Planctomycetota bacterium]|nr:DUF3343 domain-containing protein [Planctomycetota bacterium]